MPVEDVPVVQVVQRQQKLAEPRHDDLLGEVGLGVLPQDVV